MMRNHATASVFNRFSLSILVLMFALGVYAILASSRMAWQALGTIAAIIVGLIFARLHFCIWTRGSWQKLFAVVSWLCNLFLVLVSQLLVVVVEELEVLEAFIISYVNILMFSLTFLYHSGHTSQLVQFYFC